ncbi:dihydrolipoyl dehydrogenase family protein [Pseudarthrobacter sp. P1]|uniref:dihydrolipoyl dehydrogenase family protein n=1 Tax=Pseudarthrobacter sp. P1 TaxID=3418418 RepID=UPI003CF939E8
MSVEDFDLLVVGGGNAGKSLAMDLAAAGQSVAMVERGMIGGTCINVACIPTKTVVNSARLRATMRRAASFGITGADAPAVDVDLLRARKEDVVGTMVAGQRKSFLASGMDLVIGTARFVAEKTVEVELDDGGRRTLRGTNVVVNTGMVPFHPPIPGLAEAKVLDSNTILALRSLLATMGVSVTVIQRGSSLLPREDADVAQAVEDGFRAAGIEVLLGEEAVAVARAADGTVTATLASGRTATPDELLVAVGRTPATADLGPAAAGIGLDARGFIEVDEHLRATADGVWAAGDVAGTAQFTHASWNDYRILKANLAGGSLSTRDRLIPYCVFTTPELGRVGLSEAQARDAGLDIRVAKMPVAAIPRARTVGELDGVWKAVVERGTDKILGAALLGHESSEAIAVVQMAMLGGLAYH